MKFRFREENNLGKTFSSQCSYSPQCLIRFSTTSRAKKERGGKDPHQVPGPDPGGGGAGGQLADPRDRQAQVPGAQRHLGRPVHVDHPQAHPAALREGHLPLRQQDHTAVLLHHGPDLHQLQGRGRLPLHRLQRREHLRPVSHSCASTYLLVSNSLYINLII